RQSSAQLQKYSGSVLLSRNATKLSGKYHSKIVQQDRGGLKKKDVKSAAGNRAASANRAAKFSGYDKSYGLRARKNYDRYLSRERSGYTGDVKTLTAKQRRQAIVGNSMMMADYRGDVKGGSKSSRDR